MRNKIKRKYKIKREAWEVLRELRTNGRTTVEMALISVNKWKNYYEKIIKRTQFRGYNRLSTHNKNIE